ncbi:MAG: EamA family transporter [Inhella sp.]
MSTQALALVLLAALLHAGWNIAAKKARSGGEGDQIAFQTLCALAVITLWAPLGLWVAWRELGAWGWQAWAVVTLSAVVHLGYFSALLIGYRKADLTVVYPVARGSGPLMSSLAAVLLLGERPGPWGWAGIATLLFGVLLLSGMLRRRALTPPVRAGLRWGGLTGALIAGYTVIDAYGVKVLAVSPLLLDYLCNVLRLPLLLLFLARRPAGTLARTWAADWRAVLIVGSVSPLAYILVLWALQSAPLSTVAPARECSMLFAALIGGHLLQESDRVARALGALCIAAGVAMLASGA